MMNKLLFCLTLLASSYGYCLDSTAQGDAVKAKATQQAVHFQEISHSEQQCAIEQSGVSWQKIETFLTKNGVDVQRGNWLMSPYACTKLKEKAEQSTIYQLVDRDSPLRVFVIVDKTSQQFLMVKVHRESEIQLYSEGRREYIGDVKRFSKGKFILDQYLDQLKNY